MSSAQPPIVSTPAPGRDPVCRLGKWLFVPERANAAGDLRAGYLYSNGERVVLRHCSRQLSDYARTIRQIEQEFRGRCVAEQLPVAG